MEGKHGSALRLLGYGGQAGPPNEVQHPISRIERWGFIFLNHLALILKDTQNYLCQEMGVSDDRNQVSKE